MDQRSATVLSVVALLLGLAAHVSPVPFVLSLPALVLSLVMCAWWLVRCARQR